MRQIPLQTYPDYRILSKNVTKQYIRLTVMIPISEKEEEQIDNIEKRTIVFTRGNKEFSVTIRDIYCYGEVDFNDKNIFNQIENFSFLDFLEGSGVHIFSNYDYNTHSCMSDKKYLLHTETWSPAMLAKMAHGYLGKPARILLFNQTIK